MLNAFRHRRYLHHRMHVGRQAQHECSTPFGIEDTFTACLTASALHGMSAQRLSASKIPSQKEEEDSPAANKCSTPFGIEDTFTQAMHLRRWGLPKVLNAFRHRRYLHRSNGSIDNFMKEVLNAFRHRRYLHPSCRCKRLHAGTRVLNAFRHRRYLHERVVVQL